MSTNYVPPIDKQGTNPGNNHVLGKSTPWGTSGGGGGTTRGDSASNFLYVKTVSNAQDEDQQTGRTKPPIVTVEEPQSVTILMDSWDSVNQDPYTRNPFDFRAFLNSNLYRAKTFRVTKAMIPRPPNITVNNNVLTLAHLVGGGPPSAIALSFTIPPGYYSPSEFSNELNTQFAASAAPFNSYTITYNKITHTFLIEDTSKTAAFFVTDDCSFNVYGKNFCVFPSANFDLIAAGGPWPSHWVVGFTIRSNVATMMYTRYILLCSESFNNFSYAVSKTSDQKLNEDIIAIVDVAHLYSPSSWDSTVEYSGLMTSVYTPHAPHVNLRNPQRNLNPEVDAYALDEFGNDLNLTYKMYEPKPVDISAHPNQLGFAFWMEVTF